MGDGTTSRRATPVDVTGLASGVGVLTAGYYHTCAVTNGGGVKCWGDNADGQVGDGTVPYRPLPAPAWPDVNLIISAATGSEASQTAVTVTVQASWPVEGDKALNVAVSGAGITTGDYGLSAPQIAIADGASQGSVTFTVKNDSLAEGNETATLALSNPSSGIALGATTSRTVTLVDDDSAASSTVTATAGAGGTISPASATVNAGSTKQFTVTPLAGFVIASVTGCSGSLNGNIYTTGPVTANCTVSAAFAALTCSTVPATVTQSYPSGTHLVRSESTLTTQGAVTVGAGASVTFEAKNSVRLMSGFKAASGSVFVARIGQVTCSAARADLSPELTAKIADSVPRVAATPASRLLSREEIPARLLRLLDAAGAEVDLFSADRSGDRIVFATDIPLAEADRNGRSDIYIYERDAERLAALSLAPSGWTANGESLEPRIDGTGRFVVFSSDAADLTPDDSNGLSDIFVLDLEGNGLERIGADTASSRRPDLSANGDTVVFEQSDESGRWVAVYEALDGEAARLADEMGWASLHHPAISADGRFLAYLAGDGARCTVRFVDRRWGLSDQMDCPAGLIGEEEAVPLFDEDAGALWWRPPGAVWLETANPLAR